MAYYTITSFAYFLSFYFFFFNFLYQKRRLWRAGVTCVPRCRNNYSKSHEGETENAARKSSRER